MLRNRAINGVLWKTVEIVFVQGLNFVISILLARLLSPNDYGLIGMLTIFFGLTNLIVESGFSQSLVQNQKRTALDSSSVFYLNIALGLVCYILLFVSAPTISLFYKTPELTSIVRILGLNIIILSFNVVQNAHLLINIDFKTSTIVNVIGSIGGGFLGIYLAFNGYGVWALVAQQLTTSLLRTITLWFLSNWKPQLLFSMKSIKNMFSYGSKLLVSGFYSIILQNIYNLFIGKNYKANDLGFYTRAYQLPELVSGAFGGILNSVTFPVLSAMQDDKEKLISAYSKMLSTTAFVIFPVMSIMAVLSKSFVSVVLTEKWLPIVPLMIWFCFARMLTPISSTNLSLLKAIGRSDLFLKADLIKIPIIILNMVITIPIGIEAVAIGGSIVTFISYFINAYYPGKIYNYGALQQLIDCKDIIIAILITIIVTNISLIFINSDVLKLIIGIIVGLTTYLLMAFVLKIKELSMITNLIKELLISRKS